MSKFNHARISSLPTSPITATRIPGAVNHQGGDAFERDAKSELFVLAVANMVSERTFYESGSQRDERFEALCANVAVADLDWMTRFIPWLREVANMRSASEVAAASAAWALAAKGLPGARPLIDAACQRADQPGEILARWLTVVGKAIPMSVKRGLADAARRLYTQSSALKYDTPSHGVRFGDVLELCHPRPTGPVQNALFGWLLDRRPGKGRKVGGRNVSIPEALGKVAANKRVRAEAAVDPTVLTQAGALEAAGITWEQALSQAGKDVDKAALWEAKIPSMGYMALLRNLRNFDEAGVSDAVAADVGKRLADPGEVARSRQFPFRFLSAYKAAPSLRWAWPLEQALNHSLSNIPVLHGRTLILVDQSGSMFNQVSEKSMALWSDTAALFGTALALRSEKFKLVQFGSTSEDVPLHEGESVLRAVGRFRPMGGTYLLAALDRHFNGHDRVIVITDEQFAPSLQYFRQYGRPAVLEDIVPKTTPVYTWNLAGYRYGGMSANRPGRHTFAGISDAGFSVIGMLESGEQGQWPF